MTSIADLIKAADFAAKKHKDQKRKDPEQTPYINHPIGVANILANEGLKIQNRFLEKEPHNLGWLLKLDVDDPTKNQ